MTDTSDGSPSSGARSSSAVVLAQLLTLPNLGLNLFLTLAFVLAVSDGHVGWWPALLVLLAFFGARNAGHAFNQLVDRGLDAQNPRTSGRPLPRGAVSTRVAGLVVGANIALFLVAAALLRWWLVLLAVPALVLVLGYSYTKRHTPATTVILGAVQALIPVGVYLALEGTLPEVAWFAVGAMLLFGTAFECVHSLGDLEADRKLGLFSLPLSVGEARTPVLVLALLAGALALLLGFALVTVGASLLLLGAWVGMGAVAIWEVQGLRRRSTPLGQLFRAHFAMGALFLLGVVGSLLPWKF